MIQNNSSVASDVITQQCHKFHTAYNRARHTAPKYAPTYGSNSNLHILLPTLPTTRNGIQIHTAIFLQYTGQTDRQTDTGKGYMENNLYQ